MSVKFFFANHQNHRALGNLCWCRQNLYILSFTRSYMHFGDVFIDAQQRSEKLTSFYLNMFVFKIKEIDWPALT